MLMKVLLLWTILSVVPGAQHQFLKAADNVMESSSPEEAAVVDVLRDTWTPGCFVFLLTEGGVREFSDGSQLLQGLGITLVNVHFNKTSHEQKNVNNTDLSLMVQQITQVKQSSTCFSLVVISNDSNFLTKVILNSYEIITWPNRLLIVTRVPMLQFQNLRKIFAFTNSILFILDSSTRGMIYFVYPYSLRKILLATWSPVLGIMYQSQHELYPNKFFSFSDGAHLTIASRSAQPHIFVTKQQDVLSFRGPTAEVLFVLADKMNFTYTSVTDKDDAFGSPLPNGSWNGLIGMIVREEADFALVPFMFTHARWQVSEYTVPLLLDNVFILGRRGTTEVNTWSFLYPLTWSVWITALTAFLLVISASLIFSSLRLGPETHSRISLMTYHRIVLQQDINTTKIRWWERMIIGGLLLNTLILVKSYGGNLMSQLSVRYIAEPYQSLRNVLDDPQVRMLWIANSAFEYMFKTAESGILKEVANSEEDGRILYYTTADFMIRHKEHVLNGHHVSLCPLATHRIFFTDAFTNTKGDCNVYVSKESYMPSAYGPLFPKNSPLLPSVNKRVQAITEAGLYQYWLENTIPLAQGCDNPPSKITVRSSFSISNLWGIFMIFAIGCVLSISIFFLELLGANLRRYES